MGTTPNFGFPYSEDGESPWGSAQQEALAEAIDTTFADIPSDIASLLARVTALETLPQPGQVVYVGRRVNPQEIANVANPDIATAIAWDSTIYDPLPGGSREAAPNNSRIQPPVSGWYKFEGKGAIAAAIAPGDTNRARDCGFRLNGGATINGSIARDLVVAIGGADYPAAEAASNTPFAGTTLVQLNGTTDYVQMFIQQASGGPLNTLTDPRYLPTITVTYVGPL